MRPCASIVIAIAIAMLCGCRRAAKEGQAEPERYSISLPEVPLNEGERVSAVDMAIKGAHVEAIDDIPHDWWVEMGPVDGNTTRVYLSANHGASWLWHPTFSLVAVAHIGRTPDVTATVEVSWWDRDRQITLSQDDMIVTAVPRRQ